MASFIPENYESSVSHEFNTDTALLLSQLLDESHVEDCNDNERLTSVIRSLEAEIMEPGMMTEDSTSFMELEWDDNFVEIRNYISDGPVDVMNSQDCSTSSDTDDLDNYNWMDVEEMIEFGGVGDDYYHYSQCDNDIYHVNHNSYVTNILEEQSYGSLWEDDNVLV